MLDTDWRCKLRTGLPLEACVARANINKKKNENAIAANRSSRRAGVGSLLFINYRPPCKAGVIRCSALGRPVEGLEVTLCPRARQEVGSVVRGEVVSAHDNVALLS